MNIKRRLWIGPIAWILALSACFSVWASGAGSGSTAGAGSETSSGYTAGGGSETGAETGGISMDVIYGYSNNAKGNRYIPVELSLSNGTGQEFEGTVRILTMESDYDVYRHDFPIAVAAGESMEQTMYLPIGNRADQMFVEVTDQDGNQAAHKRVKLNFSLDVPELFIGVLSDTPELLHPWDGVGVDYGMLRTRTVEFSTETFPEDVIGLDMIDVLLISNFRIRDLSESQSQALVEWVRGGGTMILGTGMRADDTLGRFAPELLEESYEAPEVQTVDMGMDYARNNPSDAVLEVPCVDFVLSGGNILLSDDDKTILATVAYSQGTIAVAAFDFVDISQFCQKNPSYLDQVLTGVLGDGKINQLVEEVYNGSSSQYWSIRNMINTGNVARLPNLGLYILEIAIYIILVGAGLYIFLRQRELTDLYRSGVVVLSLMFTVIFYLMGSKTRFRDTFYTYAQFLETSWDSVSEITYMNMRAPYNRPYTAYLTEEYSVKPVTRSSYYESGTLPRFTGTEPYRVAIEHQEGQTAVSVQNVPAFEPKYFRLDKAGENEEHIGFYGDMEIERDKIRGTVTNQFQEKMENCVVLSYDKLIYLGDMEPGETKKLDDLPVLEYPRNHSYQVAAYISGESRFAGADIEDETYIEAAEKTNLLEFYLDNYMPSYTPNARVVGIRAQGDSGRTFLKTAMAEGHTVASSTISVYSSDDEVLYRPALVRQPVVHAGNYDNSTNSLFGMDPVTLEYSLGNDVWIERLTFNYVSEEFTVLHESSNLEVFSGHIYFYNHSTGMYDRMDPLKLEYESDELAPYLSPGNTIIIKYAYENVTGYNWDVLLPMLNIVGRNIDAKD